MTPATPAVEKISCFKCRDAGTKPVPQFEQLGHHLKAVHNLTTGEYQKLYPGAAIMTEKVKDSLKRAQAARSASAHAAPAGPSASTEMIKIGAAKLHIRNDIPKDDLSHVPDHDPDYELDEAALEMLAVAVEDGENTLMVGPTGLGKTTLAEELAAILNQPVIKIGLHKDFRAADFLGEKIVEVDPDTGQSVVMWRDGALPTAMKKGWWIVLDEVDAAPAGIALALQQVLEERKVRRITLTGDHGRVVEALPTFRIIGTANTIGKGDDTSLYTGTNVQNEAWLDRWGNVMQMSYLKKELEAKVLVAKTKVTLPVAQKMVEVAEFVRGAQEKEEVYCTFSTRRLLSWARKTVRLGGRHWKAASVTVFNKLSKDDRAFVENVVQRVMGRGA
jgi:cobaltochelatase CobS